MGQGDHDRRGGDDDDDDRRGDFRRESDREMHATAIRALETSMRAQALIEKHEAVCAERFRGIQNTTGLILRVLGTVGGAILAGLVAALFKLYGG